MSIINYIESKTNFDCTDIILKKLHQSYMKDLRHEIHNYNHISHVHKISEKGQWFVLHILFVYVLAGCCGIVLGFIVCYLSHPLLCIMLGLFLLNYVLT